MKTEIDFLEKIDNSFKEAATILDMGDLPPTLNDEEVEAFYEDRHHCGTCTVRTVMETVWPAIEGYLDWLKSEEDRHEER